MSDHLIASLNTVPELLEPGVIWGDTMKNDPLSCSSLSAPPLLTRDFSGLRPQHNRPIRFGPSRLPPVSSAQSVAEPTIDALTLLSVHGHGEADCTTCDHPCSCDCPCDLCIVSRRQDQEAARSYIQRALDREWESANFAGPGCPFCDAIFSCSCWAQRAEMHRAEERRQVRQDRAEIAARIARGECTCDQMTQHSDYPNECEVCRREEELRCKECGELSCKPDCCGGCGGCSRCRGEPCKRCGDFDDRCCCHEYEQRDRESECGCGACEEHSSWGDGGF